MRCMLMGTIVLSGSRDTNFIDCEDGLPGLGLPTIDCGGAGRNLGIWGYHGGIKIQNKTGPEKISVNLDTGRVVLDAATVTDGEIVIRGVGVIEGGVSGTAVLDVSGLINPSIVADAVCDELVEDHPGAGSVAATIAGTKVDTAELLARLTIGRAAALDLLPNVEAQATVCRKILKNDLKLVSGTTDNWVLMDDDGETEFLVWSVTGPTGAAIAVPVDSPAWRRLLAA